MPLTQDQQDRFDALLEEAMETFPNRFQEMLGEVSLVVMDGPTEEMVEQLRKDGVLTNEDGTVSDGSDLCGLHTGRALTDRSVQDSAELPDQIHIFREGIVKLVEEDFELTWDEPGFEEELYEEIRITVLHEVGHHFGLDEVDLDELGYA